MLSVRERMEEHRKNPACTSCHKVIDPLGLALENFDVTGRWRDQGQRRRRSTRSAMLYDGTRMSGPAGLREALLKHQDAFLLSFTEHLMTYALGRRVEAFDMPAVRRVIRDAGAAATTSSRRSSWAWWPATFQMSRSIRETTDRVGAAREHDSEHRRSADRPDRRPGHQIGKSRTTMYHHARSTCRGAPS